MLPVLWHAFDDYGVCWLCLIGQQVLRCLKDRKNNRERLRKLKRLLEVVGVESVVLWSE